MKANREEGQVIVEQALVMPMMVFLILGILQLAMIQHARIACEYAAYNAARAGIVYNGDPDKMERAAFLSLMPTYGRADSWSAIGNTIQLAAATQFGPDLADMLGLDILSNMKMVQVKILEPSDTGIFDTYGQHLNKQQLDFDDWRESAAKNNILSIRVRYYYELKVPFANMMIQLMWLAHRTGTFVANGGVSFVNPELPYVGGSAHKATLIAAAGSGFGGDEELQAVLLYRALKPQSGYRIGHSGYVLPINTWYSMRMQSNLYRTYVGN